MKKIIYSLSALMMACIISFSGVGGSYIQAHASSGAFDSLWNTDVSAWENIKKHIKLWVSGSGCFVNPSSFILEADDFYNYMISDGYTEEEANECVHGGGGHVRDGISMDENGNVTYSDGVSDLFHGYICNYLEVSNGYWVAQTMTKNCIPVEFFENVNVYNNLMSLIDYYGDCVVYIYPRSSYTEIRLADFNNKYNLVLEENNSTFDLNTSEILILEDDWIAHSPYLYMDTSNRSNLSFCLESSDFSINSIVLSTGSTTTSYFYKTSGYPFCAYISENGRLIKVWSSVDAFKNYSVGKQPYYVTQNWVNYDASQDNSITITSAEYQYYSDNSTTIYQNIQNNIDNGGDGLTEQDIQKIVEDTVKNVLDNIPSGGGSDSGDSGDDENGGTGVGAIIEGIGKLFDTILTLIGKLMGVVADFTQSILDLFSGFTTFTDGFSGFLAGAFGFIPAEIWNVIQVGLSLMILLAVIKFLRK